MNHVSKAGWTTGHAPRVFETSDTPYPESGPGPPNDVPPVLRRAHH